MRITSKGQVTIPKAVREKLGIKPGDDIGFREDGQDIIVEKKTRRKKKINPGLELANQLREIGEWARREGHWSGLSTDEIMEMTRGPFDDVKPR